MSEQRVKDDYQIIAECEECEGENVTRGYRYHLGKEDSIVDAVWMCLDCTWTKEIGGNVQ